MRSAPLAAVLAALATAPVLAANDLPDVSKAPVAKKVAHVQTIHDNQLQDDYYWRGVTVSWRDAEPCVLCRRQSAR